MSSDHYPSASSSSRSSSTSSSGERPRALVPKNISRLGRSQSYASSSKTTLDAPIDIPEFKLPSLPLPGPGPRHSAPDTHHFRRPLTMSQQANVEPSQVDPPSSTPSRLKRLSLLAKSPVLSDHAPRRSIISPLHDENSSVNPDTARNGRRSIEVGGTPRRGAGGSGMRSSFSYSPAAQTPRQSTMMQGTISEGSRRSVELAGGRALVGLFQEEEAEEEGVKGETITDKHAELLRAIAQKERRVNELKQELQAEQAALSTLRTKWTSLISNLYPSSPASTPMLASSSRLSADTHTTTSPRSPEVGDDQPGFQALLNDVLGSAPLVDPEIMEGGKRFIGNLMRTVGAAAGGTVPDKEGEVKQPASGGIDLSSLTGMFSWSSAPQPTTVRIRPSDSGSSIRDRRSPPGQIGNHKSSTDHVADLIDI